MVKYCFFLIVAALFCAARSAEYEGYMAPKMYLSEYGFFRGAIADLQAADRVIPYEVNAPLFSDYAEKARFIYLPSGTKMAYDSVQSFQFPVGAVIIKNFYYPKDAQNPSKGRTILETRLLIRQEKTWKALEYIWNETQTDAVLEVTGATIPHQWADASGTLHQFDYIAPNVNQCKGCHSFDGAFTPIGTTARQLNRGEGADNQLVQWQAAGYIDLAADFLPESSPRLSDYRTVDLSKNAPSTIARAARSYLDGNCAYCHNPNGPASTSGMFLGITEQNPERLGVGKAPVAAGRGSGDRKYGIVPGKPQESILVYRLESTDPGIRMPELGRQMVHKEGLQLIKTWIKNL